MSRIEIESNTSSYIRNLDSCLNSERKIFSPEEQEKNPPHFCVAYPDIYEHGLPNIGVGLIMQLLSKKSSIASRAFLPNTELDESISLLPIESTETGERLPVGKHDIISFNVSFETLALNVLKMLKQAGIPLKSAERDEHKPLSQEKYPLIIGAGAFVSYNPEPMAPFFDLIAIGDGETMVSHIIDLWRMGNYEGWTKQQLFLAMVQQNPGFYVPSFYEVTYNADGTIKSRFPTVMGAPEKIKRQWTTSLDPNLVRSLYVSNNTIYGEESFSLEVARGCSAGCRFCFMGNFLRPPRHLTLPEIENWVRYTQNQNLPLRLFFEALPSQFFQDMFEMLEKEVNNSHLHLGSFRVDQLNEQAVRTAGKGKLQCLIVAPETTGTLRPVINKKSITDEQILQVVDWAHQYNIPNFGLYLMTGLPTESKDDINGLADLIIRVRSQMNKVGNSSGALEVHLNTFFPKPWTPLQWTMVDLEASKSRLSQLATRIKNAGINIILDEIKTVTIGAGNLHYKPLSNTVIFKTAIGTDSEFIETMLGRGDRKLAEALKIFIENDGKTAQDFLGAMQKCDLTPANYLRQRQLEEMLPWDFIETGIKPQFLKREWGKAQLRQNTGYFCQKTPNCSACGVC